MPREAFVPPTANQPLERIYADSFIVTRWRDGSPAVSSSAPSLMARMLGLLDLAPGQRVLEIGTGSGYNAALLASIVGPHGAVVSVEIDQQAAIEADAALRRLGCVKVPPHDSRCARSQEVAPKTSRAPPARVPFESFS